MGTVKGNSKLTGLAREGDGKKDQCETLNDDQPVIGTSTDGNISSSQSTSRSGSQPQPPTPSRNTSQPNSAQESSSMAATAARVAMGSTDPRHPECSEGSTKSALIYTGRRHATGADMPFAMREDLLRAFMEPVLFAFGCRLDKTSMKDPEKRPRFVFGNMKLSTHHSGYVHRLPMDRSRNRNGIVEGPLMALHCSSDINFGRDNTDLMFTVKELCVLLSLAQERHREGKTEPDKTSYWWGKVDMDRIRSVPIGEPFYEDSATQTREEQSQRNAKFEASLAERRASSWQHRSVWGSKRAYMKIGKPVDTDVDTVSTMPVPKPPSTLDSDSCR